MIFDQCGFVDASQFTMVFRRMDPTTVLDMQECEQYYADLILECLTKKQFETEYPGEPQFGGNTHALVICYGTGKFFVYFRRPTYEMLRAYFNYPAGSPWKTHYFRFTAKSILTRLIV